MASVAPSALATSVIVEAELRYGIAKGGHAMQAPLEAFLRSIPILAFDSAAAQEYGRLRAYLESRGETIGGNDLLIAATALAHGLTLVTHNVGEFARVPGLRIEDWE